MTDTLTVNLIPEGDTGTVRLEDHFDTDIADLWSAITDPHRTARWLAVVSGDFRLGGELTASFTSAWEGTLLVEVCDAPHRLRVLARGRGDQTVMEAVLSEEGTGTRLVVEERGLPVADLPYHGAGWQVHLQDLRIVIDGGTPSPWEPRWRELLPAYGVVSE
ncbi:MAG: SRPBCC domain-containing protein [Pseudolysinimonas sp.]